jgi:hypothetical protein
MHPDLTPLEQAILEKLATAYKEKFAFLSAHLPHLRVRERKNNGTGVTVNFYYTPDGEQLIDEEAGNGLLSMPEIVVISKLKKGLGFVLDITGGRIEYLELYTDNEKWNGDVSTFKFMANNNLSA